MPFRLVWIRDDGSQEEMELAEARFHHQREYDRIFNDMQAMTEEIRMKARRWSPFGLVNDTSGTEAE